MNAITIAQGAAVVLLVASAMGCGRFAPSGNAEAAALPLPIIVAPAPYILIVNATGETTELDDIRSRIGKELRLPLNEIQQDTERLLLSKVMYRDDREYDTACRIQRILDANICQIVRVDSMPGAIVVRIGKAAFMQFENVTVTSAVGPIMKSPTDSSLVVTEAHQGDALRIVREINGFLEVVGNRRQGYLYLAHTDAAERYGYVVLLVTHEAPVYLSKTMTSESVRLSSGEKVLAYIDSDGSLSRIDNVVWPNSIPEIITVLLPGGSIGYVYRDSVEILGGYSTGDETNQRVYVDDSGRTSEPALTEEDYSHPEGI